MGEVFDHVRRAVQAERYVFSDHADNMLRERGITHWQVVTGLDEGRLLMERPGAKPNAVAEVEQLLADGAAVKVVWAWIKPLDMAKLVTVHFFDR